MHKNAFLCSTNLQQHANTRACSRCEAIVHLLLLHPHKSRIVLGATRILVRLFAREQSRDAEDDDNNDDYSKCHRYASMQIERIAPATQRHTLTVTYSNLFSTKPLADTNTQTRTRTCRNAPTAHWRTLVESELLQCAGIASCAAPSVTRTSVARTLSRAALEHLICNLRLLLLLRAVAATSRARALRMLFANIRNFLFHVPFFFHATTTTSTTTTTSSAKCGCVYI